ncbi:MAG: sodium:solute symporter [Planctomycetota bacterium]|nr:MAG: sodium:solute symporter [Planctomycetota bacterium]
MAIVVIAAFYALFFAIGVAASRWLVRAPSPGDLLLARRRLPLWLAVLTLTATWVGGGYIVGTAEAVYDPKLGLLWTQAPWCFALSLVLGGLFFAQPVRRRNCTTMLDLFEQRYGASTAGLLYLPALLGELFWIAAILSALGQVFATLVGIDPTVAILVSAAVALAYTLAGGLWSVALTDAVQLACIVAGLLVALPFALRYAGGLQHVLLQYQLSHGATFRLLPDPRIIGVPEVCAWCDSALLLIFGGIPWQVYFQRVLACRTDRGAIWLSVVAGVGCLLLALPSVIIGMVGATVDWTLVAGAAPEPQAVLPFVLRYLTPSVVALLGLCAVAAAVMSSIDSSILSAASMFSWNVYRPFSRSGSERHIKTAMRAAMIVIGALAAVLGIRVQSVYNLWYLSADLVYVVLFPQLLCALFDRRATVRGAWTGAAVGFVLRMASGEPSLGIASWVELPEFVPLRTAAMGTSLLTILAVSRLTPAASEGMASNQERPSIEERIGG